MNDHALELRGRDPLGEAITIHVRECLGTAAMWAIKKCAIMRLNSGATRRRTSAIILFFAKSGFCKFVNIMNGDLFNV